MTTGLLSFGGKTPPVWSPGDIPFASTSQINTPLPAGTPILQPILWDISTGFNYFASTKAYIDIPNISTAPTLSSIQNGTLGFPAGPYTRQMTSGFKGANTLSGAAGLDNEAISIIGTDYMEIWELWRNSDTTTSSNAGAMVDGFNILTDSGFGVSGVKAAGVTAAFSAIMAGGLLKEEYTKTGSFQHMISFTGNSSYVNAGHPILPAINNDGASTTGFLVEGCILSYPAGTPTPAGLDPIGTAIWNAIGTYGCYCNDSGGDTAFEMVQVFDASQSGSTIPFSATTSWNTTDNGHIINAANIIFPLLWKTGFLLDGFAGPSGPLGTLITAYGPQVKFNNHLAQTLMVVKRDSDSTTSNITSNGTANGLLNNTGITSFCTGTIGRASQLGNQLGTANLISGGTTTPIICQSGVIENVNSIPAPKFNGVSDFYAQASTSTLYPGTGIYINVSGVKLDDLLADYYIFGSDASGGLALKISATTGIPVLCTNTGTVIGQPFCSIASGSVYNFSVRYIPGTSWSMQINANGVGSGSTAVSATAGNLLVGQAGPTATGFFKGHIADVTVTSSMASRPQYSIENGLANFYTPLGTVTSIHNTVVNDAFLDTNGVDLSAHSMVTGTGWTDLSGTHFIQSNSAQPNGLVGGKAFSIFTPLSAGATGSPLSNGVYTCSLIPTGTASNQYTPGLLFRLSDTSNYFILQLDGVAGTARLSSVIAGAGTSLGVSTISIASGTAYTCKVTFFNNNITFAINAETPIAIVNTFNSSATKCGIRSSLTGTSTACSFDNLTYTT